MTLHRKDLVELLLRQIHASCDVHTSKRLEFYEVHPETGKITLHFCDGSHTVTDVLVGADGVRSAMRRTMYQKLASLAPDDGSRKRLSEHINPVWTGTFVYRGLVPTTKLQKEYPDAVTPQGLTLVSQIVKNAWYCWNTHISTQHLGKEKVGAEQHLTLCD